MPLMHCCVSLFCGLALIVEVAAATRINHEGRFLGELPAVSKPLLFNTPEADAVLSAMQIFPRDNPWNEDISRRPVLPNSDAMIAQVMADLRSDRRTLRPFFEMNFVLVPDNQPLVPIDFFNYADESDPSPYPIPSNMPVETWPRETGGLTLQEWQQDVNGTGGDRHSIIVMPGAGSEWETWLTRLASRSWEASNGARFDLNSNSLRPSGWTSADAAGLPMFPALVRYDECERGMVEHAMRLVVKRTRVGPIYPARHQASVGNLTSADIPAMGERFRLKSGFVIPDSWSKHEKAVLKGLKKYGAIVADNGNFFSISVTPDDRYPANAFSHLSSISITDFEVIRTTGANEGPRSPGAPRADAGPSRTTVVGQPTQLSGFVVTTNSVPVATSWIQYDGPAAAVIGDVSKTNSVVTLPTAGQYVFVLSASDGIHTPDFSAITISAAPSIAPVLLRISSQGSEVLLSWADTGAAVTIERAPGGSTFEWAALQTITGSSARLPALSNSAFYRLKLH